MNPTEASNIRNLVKLWTNFAKTGDPNGGEEITDWKPATEQEFHYLELGNCLSTGIDPDKDRYDFWYHVHNNYT